MTGTPREPVTLSRAADHLGTLANILKGGRVADMRLAEAQRK